MQKVVIVDDTRANGMLLEGFIKSLPNVSAYTFTRPLEALVWCDDHAPDLVLLDYLMPDIDGIEFLRRFRSLAHLKDVPVVMVTAALSKETLYLALHSGATDFLRKPVDRIELIARARNLLDLRERQKELEAANARLQMLASTDALTGLKNRRAFLDAVEAELDRSRRYGRPFAVATVDIDRFTAINEAYGHDVGDEILQAIAFMCAEQLRTVDQIGRIGGEEFGVLLAELPVDGAVTAAKRLLSRVARVPVPAAGSEIEFTVSIGITDAGREQDSVVKIMKRAEQALAAAKRNGGNRVELTDGAAIAAPAFHH